MLQHCQVDPWEQTLVKFESNVSSMKLSSVKWRPSCSGGAGFRIAVCTLQWKKQLMVGTFL